MKRYIAIDIETTAAEEWKTYEEAALDHNRNRITIVATKKSDEQNAVILRPETHNIFQELSTAVADGYVPVFHNAKFDIKTLYTKGMWLKNWAYEDTMLIASAHHLKVSDQYISEYNLDRKLLNKAARKEIHRKGSPHSLKTLAPYFLGVDMFWETASHDNDEYAAKDVTYTLDLFTHLIERMQPEDERFYRDKLLKWSVMLTDAELKGVNIDLTLLKELQAQSVAATDKLLPQLNSAFNDGIATYEAGQRNGLAEVYEKMCNKRLETAKDKEKTEARYAELLDAAMSKLTPFNFDSPMQLKWLLGDYYKLPLHGYLDETEESTGKTVLNKLAKEDSRIQLLLDYREQRKLSQAFYPSYLEKQFKGVMHGSFNLTGTKTGRLSASSPNLQQIPSNLHRLFIPRPGYKFICYDLGGIEPVVIAYITECPVLGGILLSGGNFHTHNCRAVLGLSGSDSEIKKHHGPERDLIKAFGLSLLYGAGPNRIRETALMHGFNWSASDCKSRYESFKQTYQQVYDYKRSLDDRLARGERLHNIFGRAYTINNRDDIHLQGFNRLIQSSASDFLLFSVEKTKTEYERQRIDALPLMFVHDEVIIEVREDQALTARDILLHNLTSMPLPTKLGNIPLTAEGGIYDCWSK